MRRSAAVTLLPLLALGLVPLIAACEPIPDPAKQPIPATRVGDKAQSGSLALLGLDESGNATLLYRRNDAERSNVVAVSLRSTSWGTPSALDGEGVPAPGANVNGNYRLWGGLSGAAGGIAVWTAPIYAGKQWTAKFNLRSARVDAAGQWSAPSDLATGLAGAEIHGFAMTAAGDGLAVWTDTDADTFRPRVTRVTPNGAPEAATILQEHTSYEQAVASSASGDSVAIWVDKTPYQSRFRISAKRQRAGAWDAQAADISPESAQSQNWPGVRMDERGNAVAHWMQGLSVYSARLDAASGWQPAKQLTEPGPSSGRDQAPRLCMNKRGDAYLTWVSGIANPFIMRLEGDNWVRVPSPPLEIVSRTLMTSIRCAVSDNGLLSVATVVSSDGQGTSVSLHSLFAGTWSSETLVPQDGAVDGPPQLAVTRTGTVLVAWERSRGDQVEVWAARR